MPTTCERGPLLAMLADQARQSSSSNPTYRVHFDGRIPMQASTAVNAQPGILRRSGRFDPSGLLVLLFRAGWVAVLEYLSDSEICGEEEGARLLRTYVGVRAH